MQNNFWSNSDGCKSCEGIGRSAFLGNPNLEEYGASSEHEDVLHFHHNTNGRFTLKSCFTFHSKGRIYAGDEGQVCKNLSY